VTRVAIGFRVKSGRAIAIALTGTEHAPSPLARAEVALCDPGVPETRQPYHHGFFRHEEDPATIARRVRIVRRCARRSVAALLASIGANRVRAALVVGSVIDPATVGNPHIRAHASEGKLFRTALADALSACGVRSDVIVEKELAAAAVSGLACGRGRVARVVSGFGEVLGGPWRADEKSAATAAWMAIAGRVTSPPVARARTRRR
jgi:hypothetical protein